MNYKLIHGDDEKKFVYSDIEILENKIEDMCTKLVEKHALRLLVRFCLDHNVRFYSGMGGWAFKPNDPSDDKWIIPIYDFDAGEWYQDDDNYFDVSDLDERALTRFGLYQKHLTGDDYILRLSELLHMEVNNFSFGEYLSDYNPI